MCKKLTPFATTYVFISQNHIACLMFSLLVLVSLTLAVVSASSNSSTNRKKLFLSTNWKCSIESPAEADQLVESINEAWAGMHSDLKENVEVSVHPPYMFLDRVRRGLDPSIAVGSQNIFDASFPNKGNTGATTPNMLSEFGCRWVLLGHSDRRNNLGETDDLIAAKAAAVLEKDDLGIVLTLGEKADQRERGETLAILEKQLGAVAAVVPPGAWGRVVLAYEPVWAVGEGAIPCAPEEAQRIHTALRAYIAKEASPEAARACRITYTGSVNAQNAKGYANLSEVDGFVIGRAGLDAAKLTSIVKILVETKQEQKATNENNEL